ncbi:MAG: hypothetical protein KF773_24725 [Deltaproteobacteria bacterium]|nr:hypothetical protein [Deltaproteobacteria bacterium]
MGNHHREHPMPDIGRGFAVAIRPSEQVKITVTFAASHENCLQIYDQGNGALLHVWNNNEDKHPVPWESNRNSGQVPQILLLVGRHKASGPDPSLWWLLSKFKTLDGDPSNKTTTVGFEDLNDNDYNDIRVTVSVR